MELDPVATAARSGDYGTALRLARRRRGWTQDYLGERVCCDGTLISRLENGRVRFTVDLLRRFADVLQLPLSTFGLADHEPPPLVAATTPRGDDDMRRRAFLLAAGAAALTAGQLESAPIARPSPATLLHARIKQALYRPEPAPSGDPRHLPAVLRLARSDYRAARYADLADRLTTAMSYSEELAADRDDPRRHALVAQTYNAVTRALYKQPATGLEWTTTDRALSAARKAEDPLLLAETERMLAVAHRRSGDYDEALGSFTRVADDLIRNRVHLQGTVAIETLCSAAYAAAKNRDRDRAHELMREAQDLCRHVANDGQHWTAVDPATNLDIYRVSIGTALHDPGYSLRAIGLVSLDALPTTERKARFLVDAAAARLAAGQLDTALGTLRLAVHVAPQDVPARATSKAVAETLRRVRPDMEAALLGLGLVPKARRSVL